ncbi:hypothetical protein L1887_03543 [Cichorium endivia]|nr:hypothetical protein L1887_03543 [Cichorium endivia]
MALLLPLPKKGFALLFSEVYLEKTDDEVIIDTPQLKALKVKLEEIRIICGSFGPRQKNGFNCPMCKGGDSKEKKLSLFISDDGNAAGDYSIISTSNKFNEFSSFEEVPKLYKELFRSDGKHLSEFPVPQVIHGDESAWRTDEEFGREMLAGINPVVIRRLQEFPPCSELDPIWQPKQYNVCACGF